MKSVKNFIYMVFMICLDKAIEGLFYLGQFTRKIYHPYRSKPEFVFAQVSFRVLILVVILLTSPFVIMGYLFRVDRITDGYPEFVSEIWKPLNWKNYEYRHKFYKVGIDW